METITVNKAALIETLQRNRSEHRSIFEQAQQVYRQKWIDILDQRLEDAKNGERINRVFYLPEPEDHTSDFDTALDMLAWEVGDTVDLDEHTFRRLVRNEWAWRASFAANTAAYLAD
jgi:hypothetical protein